MSYGKHRKLLERRFEEGHLLDFIAKRKDLIKAGEDEKDSAKKLDVLRSMQRRDAEILERVQKTMRGLT
jgi:hypothetical protein